MWGSLRWHTLRQLVGSPRGGETESPLRTVLFFELPMLPPGEMFLGLMATRPALGEHSRILTLLWVGFCGQISRVHKDDRQTPFELCAWPPKRPGLEPEAWWLWLTMEADPSLSLH